MQFIYNISNSDDYLAFESLLKEKAQDGLMIKKIQGSFIYFEEISPGNYDFKIDYTKKSKRIDLEESIICIDDYLHRISYKESELHSPEVSDYQENVLKFKWTPIVNLLIALMIIPFLHYTSILNNVNLALLLVPQFALLVFYVNKSLSLYNYFKYKKNTNYFIENRSSVFKMRLVTSIISKVPFLILVSAILGYYSLVLYALLLVFILLSHYLSLSNKSTRVFEKLKTLIFIAILMYVMPMCFQEMGVARHLEELLTMKNTEYQESLRPVLKLNDYSDVDEINYGSYHSKSFLVDDYYFHIETHSIEDESQFGRFSCGLKHVHYVETERLEVSNEIINEYIYKQFFNKLNEYELKDVSQLYDLDKVIISGHDILIKHESLIIRLTVKIDFEDEEEINKIKILLDL